MRRYPCRRCEDMRHQRPRVHRAILQRGRDPGDGRLAVALPPNLRRVDR
jgi:hypothetical protein